MNTTNQVTDFIIFLQDHLDELIIKYRDNLIQAQIALRQIFVADSEEQITKLVRNDLEEILNSLSQNIISNSSTNFFKNNIDEVNILKILSAQKKSFLSLLPLYTSDINLVLAIYDFFEYYYLQLSEKIVNDLILLQKELLEKIKHLLLVFNSTSELMLLIRVEPNNIFRPISVNKAYLEATKFYNIDIKEDEFLNRTIEEGIRDYFNFDDKIIDFVLERYTTASKSKEPISYIETLDAPNGLKYFAETTLTPIHDSDGNCTHLLFVSRDISKHKWSEEELARQKIELKRSNEDLEQFAYIASHDLQEPLRMISSYVQLLEKNYKNKLDNDANDFIHFTVDGVHRMQALLHGLLDYSRISSKDSQHELIDFNDIIKQVLANLSLSIKENEVTVTFENLPSIKASQSQMISLFQNLLTNAIKYHSDKKNQINISAKFIDNSWLFSVKDNGIGIEEEYFERIFSIFQRLHTRNNYPGDGLGLALCKKIIEKHNGKIWVESEFGKGSNFLFTIPS